MLIIVIKLSLCVYVRDVGDVGKSMVGVVWYCMEVAKSSMHGGE